VGKRHEMMLESQLPNILSATKSKAEKGMLITWMKNTSKRRDVIITKCQNHKKRERIP